MARKMILPLSAVMLLIGIAMVVWSLNRSGDSTTSTTPESSVASPEVSTVEPPDSESTIATSSTSTPESSAAVTVSSGVTTPVATRAPGSSTAPATVAPSVTVRPLSPSVSSAPTTTVAPLSIPPLVATPGTVAAPACTSFADCAQKLFNAWLSPDRDARTRALNYGTREAVSSLFYVTTIGVTWDPTVRRSTALKYVATGSVTLPSGGGRGSKSIEFYFTSGQTGFKVQRVEHF